MPKLFSNDSVDSAVLVHRLIAVGYDLPENSIIVGENILLDQFVKAADGQIGRLTLESGEIEFVCANESLLTAMLEGEDGNYITASSLLDDWQALHQREIEPLHRLVPTLPFILGGEFVAENLHSVDREEAIGYLISVFSQTKELGDGTKVTLKVTE